MLRHPTRKAYVRAELMLVLGNATKRTARSGFAIPMTSEDRFSARLDVERESQIHFFWATRKIPFSKSSMSHRCLFCPYVHHGWLRRSERIWLHKWFFHTVARVKRVETRVSNSTMKSEAQGWSSEPLSPTTYIPYIVSQVPTDLQEVCFRICVCTLSNILCFLKR